MKDYILELLRNNIWVFPIRGKGKDINEAKQPLAFCMVGSKYHECSELLRETRKEIIEKYRELAKREKKSLCQILCEDYYDGRYVTWKSEEILSIAEELARRDHYAWAVWLMKSKRFGIDIDLYKAREDLNYDIVEALMNVRDIYSEMSARGGIHIILTVNDDKKYKLVSTKPWLEYKHDGYFIIAPSILKTPEGEYRYTHIAGNLLETATIDEWEFYKDLILHDIEAKIVPEAEAGKVFEGEEVRIEGLKLDIDELTDEQITALLYLLFNEVECSGMMKLMEWIGEHKVAPIKKQMYNLLRIPRTTRWLTQYVLASVLAWLGSSETRTAGWLMSWKFIDEDEEPRKDSLNNALYNVYRRQQLLLMPRGTCPFCPLLLNRESCNETPIVKVMRLHHGKVEKIIRFVKRHIH